MRARDTTTLGAIRLILAKLKEVDIAARTEASREGVADDRILSMLQGMIKQRNESVVLYEKGNRPELAEKEKAEIAVIERFLPKQMDEAAVAAAVAEAVAATGAKTVKDMGGVMAALKAKYAGQMDFAKASAAVKKALGFEPAADPELLRREAARCMQQADRLVIQHEYAVSCVLGAVNRVTRADLDTQVLTAWPSPRASSTNCARASACPTSSAARSR